jgi:exodeoxyribonuclease VII large subunit
LSASKEKSPELVLESVPERSDRQVFSVSDLTRNVRFVLEQNFPGVWVEGEIGNFKWHTSGHMYFSLKDENAQVSCVMFRRENQAVKFDPKEGLSVLCYGRISVYAPRGQYQLYVERLEPKGVGALQLRFEELKEKLRREGLFDEAHKKEIPFLPKTIGVVTSLDGAALRDILHVIERRFPAVRLLILPVPVQGAGAAGRIAAALDDLNAHHEAGVLIVARGGGSLEDLWAFNEEIVARAIYRSEIPVITGIGHEVDYTIADFVADLRAPTPSAAAEMVLPVKEELLARVEELRSRSTQATLALLKDRRQRLKQVEKSRGLRDPLAVFEIQFQKLDELKKTLTQSFLSFLRQQKERAASLVGKLEALGPLATLKRGFSVSLKLPGEKVLTSADSVRPGDLVRTRLHRGWFTSQVKEINP